MKEMIDVRTELHRRALTSTMSCECDPRQGRKIVLMEIILRVAFPTRILWWLQRFRRWLISLGKALARSFVSGRKWQLKQRSTIER